jgi:hypothetical protein
MSIESLRKRRDVGWVEDMKKEAFGPPAFDEKPLYYKWRMFKRGFTWGKHRSLLQIGFMLSSVALLQYQAFIFLMRPGLIRPSSVFITTLNYGLLIGGVFGIYENICYP